MNIRFRPSLSNRLQNSMNQAKTTFGEVRERVADRAQETVSLAIYDQLKTSPKNTTNGWPVTVGEFYASRPALLKFSYLLGAGVGIAAGGLGALGAASQTFFERNP